MRGKDPKKNDRARLLRRGSTCAETELWKRHRNRQLGGFLTLSPRAGRGNQRTADSPCSMEASFGKAAGAVSRLARLRPRVSGRSTSITIMIPEATALNTAIVAPRGSVWLTNPTIVGKKEPIARPAL